MPDTSPLNPFGRDDAARRFEHAAAALADVELGEGGSACGEATWAGWCALRRGHRLAEVNEDGHVSRHLATLCQQQIRQVLDV